uniref:Uncharacterized protein n=1 Tax=Panagrolaimus superbus TaxID=310955 RepID=A0A914YXP8_9BILA
MVLFLKTLFFQFLFLLSPEPSPAIARNAINPNALKTLDDSEWPSLAPNVVIPSQGNIKTGYSNKLRQPASNTWAATANIAHQNTVNSSKNQLSDVTVQRPQQNISNPKKKKSSKKNKKSLQSNLKTLHGEQENQNKTKRLRNKGLTEWVDEIEGNEDDAFERFELTQSVYNYYKSYGYKQENDIVFDPKNANVEPFISEISDNIDIYESDPSMDDDDDDDEHEENSSEQKPRKQKFHVTDKDFEFPKIYQDLLSRARINKKLNYNLLNQFPFDEEILQNLEIGFSDVFGAKEKLKIFNYLQLIQEILDTDDPVAQGATVTLEDPQSRRLRKLFIQKQQFQKQLVDGKRTKKVMVIKVPFQANTKNTENGQSSGTIEKINVMQQIYLIRDIDVANGVENAKYYKVRIAMTFPSENNGQITLIAIMDELELKLLSGLSGNVCNSVIIELIKNSFFRLFQFFLFQTLKGQMPF